MRRYAYSQQITYRRMVQIQHMAVLGLLKEIWFIKLGSITLLASVETEGLFLMGA